MTNVIMPASVQTVQLRFYNYLSSFNFDSLLDERYFRSAGIMKTYSFSLNIFARKSFFNTICSLFY